MRGDKRTAEDREIQRNMSGQPSTSEHGTQWL